jgi:2-oxoglutarate dehydrogenase E2 component (dihydrolipoamide succinyltransferase)
LDNDNDTRVLQTYLLQLFAADVLPAAGGDAANASARALTKGLVVPVLRDADRLSFAKVEQGIGDLAKKARDNKLSLDDFKEGTFTISNGGVFGSLMSTPILNPPQVGILGMHAINDRPIGVNGQIVLRPMMYVALSYDHRIIDGREAVSFLKRVKELVEAPERLLLEV